MFFSLPFNLTREAIWNITRGHSKSGGRTGIPNRKSFFALKVSLPSRLYTFCWILTGDNVTEHCRKIFGSIIFKYLFEKQVQKCFSYLLDRRLASAALQMRSCCILAGLRRRFETLAVVAEQRQQAGGWNRLKSSGAAERHPLSPEKLGKLHTLEATQEEPATAWKELEPDRSFSSEKGRGSRMRSMCRSEQRNCPADKVEDTVSQSAVLQWAQNNAEQGLREGVFTGSGRQEAEAGLSSVGWEGCLWTQRQPVSLHPHTQERLWQPLSANSSSLRSIQLP